MVKATKKVIKLLDFHAKLVIYGLPDMDAATLERLSAWMSVKAKDFKTIKGKNYHRVYIAKLMK